MVQLRDLLVVALVTLAAALPARGDLLPAAGGAEHGWLAIPVGADGQQVAGLYHFPGSIDPGGARVGPRLLGTVTNLAVGEDRLIIVQDEIASPPPAPRATDGKKQLPAPAPKRRVMAITIRPGLAPGRFEYWPLNRAPESLPSLPDWGRLEGVAMLGSTPFALLAPTTDSPAPGPAPEQRELLRLQGLRWESSPLPDALAPDARAWLLGDAGGLWIVQRAGPDRARVWSIGKNGTEWIGEDLESPQGVDLYLVSGGQLIGADVDGEGEVGFWLLRPQGAHPLESATVASGGRAVFPVGERLYTVWKPEGADPRLQVSVVSSVTGASLYAGPVGADPIISGRELQTLAMLLGFVLLTVMIFALRPDSAQRPIGALPEGWSLAGPGMRALAVMIDLVPGLVIGAVVFRVQPGDMLSAAMLSPDMLMRDVAALLTAIGVTIVHSALSEHLTGRTLGKRLLGLRVVSIDGRRPTLWQATARSALKFLCPPLALFVFLDVMSRHPADVLTGSAVIRKAPEPKPGPPSPDGGD
mgnify:CR=1 FL=1